VTLHLYDVTDIVGTAGSASDRKSRQQALEMQARRQLDAQGFSLPFDHEDEDGSASTTAWRTSTDILRRPLQRLNLPRSGDGSKDHGGRTTLPGRPGADGIGPVD
jgi:hypothetical protein